MASPEKQLGHTDQPTLTDSRYPDMSGLSHCPCQFYARLDILLLVGRGAFTYLSLSIYLFFQIFINLSSQFENAFFHSCATSSLRVRFTAAKILFTLAF